MKSHQSGFTLIELIVVIVILGILAATALPKFVDLGGDARKSAMKAVEGSLRAANGMIYAKSAAANALTAGPTSISVGAATVSVAYGFAATASALSGAMDMSSDFVLAGTGTDEFRHAKATTPSTCMVKYTPASAANIPPIYEFKDEGC